MVEILTFDAEIRTVQAKKLITNDMEYKLTITTSDARLLQLGAIDPDKIIQVTIKLE